MEVSNEIKEDIRRLQSDLKYAIKVHQVWVTRLQEDENNITFKTKAEEAEKEIIAIGQSQKLVIDRLRRELELYQQRLKSRNKPVNPESDTRYVAQQIKEHQQQYLKRSRGISLLKPNLLNKVLSDKNGKENLFHTENEFKLLLEIEKEDSTHDITFKNRLHRKYSNASPENNFIHTTNNDKSSCGDSNASKDWEDRDSDHYQDQVQEDDCAPESDHGLSQRSDSEYDADHSPTPSPIPIPDNEGDLSQSTFLRIVNLISHEQKDLLIKKRNERKKRTTTSTNKTDFLYDNFDSKRKKYNQFPYLQSHSDPPQTRSAKLRKQQLSTSNKPRDKSPSESFSENKRWKPSWASNLLPEVSLEPVFASEEPKKNCNVCNRNDVPTLLCSCESCDACVHTSCVQTRGRCPCGGALVDPPRSNNTANYKDKLAERKRLQEKNVQLCTELRKLEARAETLKESLDDHHAEKKQLLAAQIKTQRNLQKLLDFIGQIKETSVSMRSTSASESGSEASKSNEERDDE